MEPPPRALDLVALIYSLWLNLRAGFWWFALVVCRARWMTDLQLPPAHGVQAWIDEDRKKCPDGCLRLAYLWKHSGGSLAELRELFVDSDDEIRAPIRVALPGAAGKMARLTIVMRPFRNLWAVEHSVGANGTLCACRRERAFSLSSADLGSLLNPYLNRRRGCSELLASLGIRRAARSVVATM